MIDLNDMVIFAKVAELQGISPAARALKMPKSKVSRRLVQLEESLGIRLLERSTRSVSVTEAGRLYWQYCQRVVEEADSALESVQQLSDAPRGHLRISTSVGIGHYLVAPYMADFLRTYPEIKLDIDMSNRRVDVIAEGFDLAVRVGQLDDSNLVCRRLGGGRSCLFASPDYLQRNGMPKSLDDLADHRILLMSDSGRFGQWSFEDEAGKQHTLEVEPSLSMNDFTSLCRVLVDGGGIANLPRYIVDDFVTEGLLQPVLPELRSPEINFYVLYPSHRGLTRKAGVWVDFLMERISKGLALE